jgi:hypothetical protein
MPIVEPVERNVTSWVLEHRLITAGVALVIVAAAVGVFVVTGNDDQSKARIAQPGGDLTRPGRSSTSAQAPSSGAYDGRSTAGGGSVGAPSQIISRLAAGANAVGCRPARANEIGVTNSRITIGQIVTDSNQLPAQLKPASEGLQAFVKVFNAAGGLCHRALRLEYRNDNGLPSQHVSDRQTLADSVFGFVANESILDFLDYQRSPPFDPTFRGGGSYVPDVGGLAISYGHSQSAWHAGVVGSLSPVLAGPHQFKFFRDELNAKGTPCRKAGIVYIREPTGAAEDQAHLIQVPLEASWGGGLGKGNTQLYAVNLEDPEPAYEALVERMVADGMNCTFAATDVQSSVQFVHAMNGRGVWPPETCTRGPACFRLVWVPPTSYDSKFIKDGGEGARDVTTIIPHVPLTDTTNPALRLYLESLKSVRGAHGSTMSILGFASGLMFVQALQTCPAAPTRTCLMDALRKMKGFTAVGLLGGTTPFRRTRVTYSSYTFDWKWLFNHSVLVRVGDRGGKRDFYRIDPASGFVVEDLRVVRGTPG